MSESEEHYSALEIAQENGWEIVPGDQIDRHAHFHWKNVCIQCRTRPPQNATNEHMKGSLILCDECFLSKGKK